MTPNPAMMPKKSNQMHLQVLGALTKTKPTSWTRRRLDPSSPDPRKPRTINTRVAGSELSNALARNISEENVDRLARRWSR